ncbi:helix-turn-helix domain-containing protein [Streptomyces sp. NPDC048507]|uniref:helix-turn-helix domain-containing protein n=1 Tax=Streptomyces sp. NPDC048507 TaxID=3365560 RepID=UPI0037110DE7
MRVRGTTPGTPQGPSAAPQASNEWSRLRHGRPRPLVIDAEVYRDARLSATAKGVYGLLALLPDDAEISAAALAAGTPDSPASVQAALDELAHFGYLADVTE